MSVSLDAMGVLADPSTRLVFDSVVQARAVRLGDLVEKLAGHVDKEAAIARLQQLQTVGLIEEKKTSLPEWNTYIITADGLEAKRRIR